MISAILYQLTRNLSIEEIKKSGFDTYFVDHTTGIYPVAASGVPFRAEYLGVKGDVFADLNEDLAADAAIISLEIMYIYALYTAYIRLIFIAIFVKINNFHHQLNPYVLNIAISFI